MAGTRSIRRSVSLLMVAAVVAGAPPSPPLPVAAEAGISGSDPVASLPERPPSLPATVDDINESTPTLARRDALTTRLNRASNREADALTAVEVLPTSTTNADDVGARVVDLGGTVLHSSPGYVLARLPLRQVPVLRAAPGVAEVREPVDLRRHSANAAPYGSVTSEASVGAVSWHQNGLLGAGAKVGIIDIFDTALLDQQVALGDLAPIPAERRMCSWLGAPCPFGAPGVRHGNAVAEIIHDTAPGVELYLAEVGTIADYHIAVDWFAARGVHLINHSATGPFDGRGDGTGPSAQVVDHAVNSGMAWFNSAGNAASDPAYTRFAGAYHRQLWSDPDNDRWLNFSGTDESLNIFCGALQGLRWSDWGQGAAATDYQLYISDYNPARFISPTLYSDANQRAGAAPIEGATMDWLCNDNPAFGPVYDTNGDGVVQLWVRRRTESTAASASGDILEVRVNGGFLEYSSSAFSGSGPFADTKNPGAAAVGALHSTGSGHRSAPYSSVGPTNDGRPKPDVLAPSCVSTVAYGARSDYDCKNAGFAGTSASAPFAVGLAALGRSAFGPASPSQIVGFVTQQAADVNRWATYMSAPRRPRPNALVSVQPTRLLDTRNAIGVSTTTKVTAGQLINVDTEPNFQYSTDDSAVVLNITFVQSDGAGYVQVFPRSGGYSGASATLTVAAPNSAASVMTVVPTNERRAISVYASVGGHIIIDKIGVQGQLPGLEFRGPPMVTIRPFRVLDSETCLGLAVCSGSPLTAGTTTVQVTGRANPDDPSTVIPPNSLWVLVSITARQPSANGFFRAKPFTDPAYRHSNLNVTSGRDATGLALVALTNGTFKLDQSTGAHVSVDIVGYAVPGVIQGSVGMFVPMAPQRTLNTRQPVGSPPLGANSILDVTVTGVPEAQVAAVLGTLTTVGGAGAGFTQLWSGSDPSPSAYRTSSHSGDPGATSTAAVTTVIDRTFRARSSVTTHLVFDIAGWFVGPETPHADEDVELIAGQVGDNPAHSPLAESMRISTDGAMVAFVTYESLVSEDTNDSRDLYLWRRATRSFSLIEAIPLSTNYDWVANSPDLLILREDAELVRVNATTSATTVITDGQFGRPDTTSALFSFSADARVIAIAGTPNIPLVIDLANNTSMYVTGWALAVSPNGQWIIDAGGTFVSRWERGNSTPTRFDFPFSSYGALGVGQGGARAVLASSNGFFVVNLATGVVERQVNASSPVFSESLNAYAGRSPGSNTPLRPASLTDFTASAGPLLSGPSRTLNVRTDGATPDHVQGYDVSGDGTIAGVLTRDSLDPGSVPTATGATYGAYMYLVALS